MITKFRWHLRRFTSVEILAVAAIIAAVPTSSFQKVHEHALELKCRNNLSQIGQFLQMYVIENDFYPKATFFPSDLGKGNDNISKLLEGPKRLWICPSLPGELADKGLTFVYNDRIAGKRTLKNPQKTWVLIEMTCTSEKAPHPHPGGYNILFADGHVVTSKRLPKKITSAFE